MEQLKHLAEETPIFSFLKLIAHQLMGWQLYLFINVTAGKKSGPDGGDKVKFASHYNPSSAIFSSSQWKLIALSDVGLIIMGSILCYTGSFIGVWNVVLLYLIPYLWVHHWLSMSNHPCHKGDARNEN